MNNANNNKMNYLETKTILTSDGIEYKEVRLWMYNETTKKGRNTYFINGKKVVRSERFNVEEKLNNSRQTIITYKEYTK